MKRLLRPVSRSLDFLRYAVSLAKNPLLLSDNRDVSRLGLKQEEGYVWQGSQNHAYGKAKFNLGTAHWFEDSSPTSRPARTLDRTGIWRHVQCGDQLHHRLAAKAGRPVEATLEAVVSGAGGHRVSRIASRTSPRYRRCPERCAAERVAGQIHRRRSNAGSGHRL